MMRESPSSSGRSLDLEVLFFQGLEFQRREDDARCGDFLSFQELEHHLFDLRRGQEERVAVYGAFDNQMLAVGETAPHLFGVADRSPHVECPADKKSGYL